MPRKRKQKIYWTKETDEAILAYNNSDNPDQKSDIFKKYIYYPCYKLAENIIHNRKLYYTDVDDLEHLKYQAIEFLETRLYKYTDIEKNGFYYFNITCRNYLIDLNKKNYQKLKQKADLVEVDTDEGVLNNFEIAEASEELHEFFDRYVEFLERKMDTMFKNNKDELKVMDAIIHIIKNRNKIDNLNKKAIYIYIREVTQLPTNIITRVTKELKEHFMYIYKQDYL